MSEQKQPDEMPNAVEQPPTPTPSPKEFEARFRTAHTDDEPTHVGPIEQPVDDRFDRSELGGEG